MKYAQAKEIADQYVSELAPMCHRIEIGGSIRRKKQDDIKDVEIVLIPKPEEMLELADYFRKHKPIKGKFPGKYLQLKHGLTHIDIFITTVECWGCIFFIRTGSMEFVRSVVSQAPLLLFKFHEGRLRFIRPDGELGTMVYTPQETDVFKALGLPYLKPEERNRAIVIKTV